MFLDTYIDTHCKMFTQTIASLFGIAAISCCGPREQLQESEEEEEEDDEEEEDSGARTDQTHLLKVRSQKEIFQSEKIDFDNVDLPHASVA